MSRRRETLNIWPGFVDALATLLLMFMFVLTLFVVAQFYLSDALTGSQEALKRLEGDIAELSETLNLERARGNELAQQVAALQDELKVTIASLEQSQTELGSSEAAREAALLELASLKQDIAALRELREELENKVGQLAAALAERESHIGALRDRRKALEAELADQRERTLLQQKEISEREIRIEELSAQLAAQRQSAEDAVERLNRQIAALREQLTRLAATLELKEGTITEQQARIEELDRKLNLALVEKVQELSRYRSEFFGRLRDVLGEREDIRIVGDRFVLQSELFFESGSAELGEAGKQKLAQVAQTLKQIGAEIPQDVAWVLQVEGHTDIRPIRTEQYPSNWELSTARATSIVHFLIEQGIPAERLAAAGFAQYQPVDPRETPEAFRRNRRIELKLTGR